MSDCILKMKIYLEKNDATELNTTISYDTTSHIKE